MKDKVGEEAGVEKKKISRVESLGQSRISEALNALGVINLKIEPFITTQLETWEPQIRGLEIAIYIKITINNKYWNHIW